MHQNATVVLLVALLAACSSNQDSHDQEVGKLPAHIAPMPVAAQACPEMFYYPFPVNGIKFGFPFHLKSDRIRQAGEGSARAAVILEHLDGTADTVWAGASSALQAVGYSA